MSVRHRLHRDDWVYLHSANVHICNDRSLFTAYRPFKSHFRNGHGPDDRCDVEGIGGVVLDCKTSLTLSGPQSHNLIRLENVLYAPTYLCNIFKNSHRADMVWKDCGDDEIRIHSCQRTACIFEKRTFWQLRLRGQPSAHGSVQTAGPRMHYLLLAQWPNAERIRCLDSLESPKPAAKPRVVSELNSYTTAEKEWLKQHYGGEFNFLRCNGWKIHDEEDRADGRRLVRAFMSQDDDTSETPEAAANDMTGNSAPLDAAEKQFMLKRYGSEDNYVADHHWDFDDPHDIALGRRWLRYLKKEASRATHGT